MNGVRRRVSARGFMIGMLVACVLVAGVASSWASGSPDGLEFVAGSLGFDASAQESPLAGSPLAGYATSGVAHPGLSGGIAGIGGCALTFGAAWLVGAVARGRRRPTVVGGPR